MLNSALRTLNGDIMIRMGFFLCDVHRQIQAMYNNQVSNYRGRILTVFRGQGVSKADFEKLTNNKDALISFNNFLSTSTKRDVSVKFAKEGSRTNDTVGILFIITIDPTVSTTPFASIQEMSEMPGEDEILFSMHTVFRIGDIREDGNNNSIYEIDLKLTSDDDPQLHELSDFIRKEITGRRWHRMGQLLLKIGQFDKAEELYLALLEQTPEDSDKALIYNQLGLVKKDQGKYEEAVTFSKESLKIERIIPILLIPTLISVKCITSWVTTRKHLNFTKNHLK
jgi:tetratricopeptide (TPR) repeat protein